MNGDKRVEKFRVGDKVRLVCDSIFRDDIGEVIESPIADGTVRIRLMVFSRPVELILDTSIMELADSTQS
jgi:transcription antitermination factor NusG